MTCSGRKLLQPLFFSLFLSLKCEPQGSFFLVIYPLVSTLSCGPIPTKQFSSIKRKAFQQPIVLNNDSSLKSLLFTTYFLLLKVHLWHQNYRLNVRWKLLLILNSETVTLYEKVYTPLRGIAFTPFLFANIFN